MHLPIVILLENGLLCITRSPSSSTDNGFECGLSSHLNRNTLLTSLK